METSTTRVRSEKVHLVTSLEISDPFGTMTSEPSAVRMTLARMPMRLTYLSLVGVLQSRRLHGAGQCDQPHERDSAGNRHRGSDSRRPRRPSWRRASVVLPGRDDGHSFIAGRLCDHSCPLSCFRTKRRNLEGKSKYCLRWKLLKTGGESKASRSIALRIFIRGMRGLLDRGSEPPILQGLPPACRAFYERSRSRWRTDGGEKVCPARVSRNG